MSESRPDTNAEEHLASTTAELDDRLQRLEGHLEEAQDKAAQVRADAHPGSEEAGEAAAGDP